jgi:UDP-glucose 4-epimerase
MHALITGGAGFIGSHLAEELLKQGHTVSVVDDLSTGCSENIEHLAGRPKFHFTIDTITNELVLDRLVSEADVIFHLAAAVGVELIVKFPVRVIETNILGTEAVLRVANRYRCKVLLASSSEIYGKSKKIPFCEEDDRVLGPTTRSRWSYSASKAVDEFLTLAYYREHGLPVIICRLFNTVGPRQTGQYGMVVPRFVRAALEGKPIQVYGNGTQTRSFMDVHDAVRGIVGLALHDGAVGNVYNLGSSEEISILDLAHSVKAKTRSSSNIVFVPYDKAYSPGFEDMERRVPDTSKVQSLIEWVTKRSLDDILDGVIVYEKKLMKLQTSE